MQAASWSRQALGREGRHRSLLLSGQRSGSAPPPLALHRRQREEQGSKEHAQQVLDPHHGGNSTRSGSLLLPAAVYFLRTGRKACQSASQVSTLPFPSIMGCYILHQAVADLCMFFQQLVGP
jgi:hypothetical protein